MAHLGSYTGPVYTDDGYRCGFVQNATITGRIRDAWLEHLTVEAGYSLWYVTRVAENPPAPLVIDAMGARHEVTAVSVARDRPFTPRGGYEVGYYTGDQVIARVDTPGEPAVYHVYQRLHGGQWRRVTPEMSAAEYEAWNGLPDEVTRGAERIPALVEWLSTVPAPPVYLVVRTAALASSMVRTWSITVHPGATHQG